LIDACIAIMKEHGAEFFEVTEGLSTTPYANQGRGRSELKVELNKYLAQTPRDFPVRPKIAAALAEMLRR
jgi:hypothetical protein